MSQRIWLITGVSTGFGRELTQPLLVKSTLAGFFD